MIKNVLFVATGGALGSVARYLLTTLFAYFALCGEWAILLANVLGSFLIGLSIPTLSNSAYLFAAVGFCGGFTTFSTFSSQTLQLFQSGERFTAMVYMIVSVLASVLSVMFGIYFADRFIK